MKMATHNIFSTGVMLYVLALFNPPLITALLAVLATLLTNLVIDELGHASEYGTFRRTWVTHSIITALLWGEAAWAITLILAAALVGTFPPKLLLEFFASLGAIAGWSHLLLDSITEGGVFAFDGRQRAIAHFPYDNLPLNLGFSALGVGFLLVAFLQ